MSDRSIDLFDLPHPIGKGKHGTTHIHAYIRGANGWYTLFVCPYTPETAAGLEGVRRYPLSATEAVRVEPCSRFSAKRLAALAVDPAVLNEARALAGLD